MASATTLGFLTVLQEGGYLGGYLVTNSWGRPLEFRLSTTVQPSRVQQLLYGPSLQSYICGELIGKTLVEKSSTSVQIIITDCQPVLELRRSIDIPVVWLGSSKENGEDKEPKIANCKFAYCNSQSPPESEVAFLPVGNVFCHPEWLSDKPAIRRCIERLNETLELSEPFVRIREAIAEGRKIGLTARGQ